MRAELSQMFVLDEAFMRGASRADFLEKSADVKRWAAGECGAPLKLQQCGGKKLADLVGTTYAGFYLLSQRVLAELDRAGVTGWRACEVEWMGKSGRIEGYSALGIIGRCGPLDNTRSKQISRLEPARGTSTQTWLGLYFDEDTWDGRDLFRPVGTMLTVLTTRAMEAIDRAKATNIRLRPLLEFERFVL